MVQGLFRFRVKMISLRMNLWEEAYHGKHTIADGKVPCCLSACVQGARVEWRHRHKAFIGRDSLCCPWSGSPGDSFPHHTDRRYPGCFSDSPCFSPPLKSGGTHDQILGRRSLHCGFVWCPLMMSELWVCRGRPHRWTAMSSVRYLHPSRHTKGVCWEPPSS